MVLDLALRDFHENFEKPISPRLKLEERVFEEQQVVVDNYYFVRCSLLKCHLLFAGGPCQFEDCQYDAKTMLSLTGAAARGHVLWERLRKPEPGWGCPLG